MATHTGIVTRAGELTRDRHRRPVIAFEYTPDDQPPLECRYWPEGSVFNALHRFSKGQKLGLTTLRSGFVHHVKTVEPQTPPKSHKARAQASPAAAILATLA